MNQPALWEEVWEVLNSEFSSLAVAVEKENGGKAWQAEHRDSEGTALLGLASFFDPGIDSDEDIVVQVLVTRQDGAYRWTSDICHGLGHFFSEGPEFTEPKSKPLVHWLGPALDQTITWLRAETPNIVGYLSGGETSYVLPPP